MTKTAKTLSLLFLFVLFGTVHVFAQDDEVRGAFMTTRPRVSGGASGSSSNTKPSRRRPKTVVKNTPNETSSTKGADKSSKPKEPIKPTVMPHRIGVGLTLFMRDSNGMAIRTDPASDFKSGDRVRVLLETNADGYLYIFNTTNNGAPVLIYPDAEIDQAGNYLQAHVPFEIPSSLGDEERLRWFAFDQNPGEEKLYFVFTREPLDGVPIEDDLITLCRSSKTSCPWKPSAELWAAIQSGVADAVKSAKASMYGKAETESERQANVRGIGLNRDDPEPSLIMLSSSTDKKILVVPLVLNHSAVAAGH